MSRLPLSRSLATAVVTAALTAASAAAQASPPPPADGAPMNGAMQPMPPRAMAPGGGETPEQMFTDARIAAVASASNFGEIDPSQIAVTKGQSRQVKDFARQMIDDHTRLEQGLRALLQKKNVRPEDNALSLQLKRNGPPTLDMLRAKDGAAFDQAYVLQQLESHDMTLMTLDTSLIPGARDPEMKAMLRDVVRPMVAQHLQRVRAMHDAMMTTAAR